MTVKQTADTLTVERRAATAADASYKLDGSESRHADGPDDRQGQREVGRQQARDHHQDRAGEQIQTWSLAGSTLTIDRTGGRGPAKTMYKKTT